jgi:hypothetical protein
METARKPAGARTVSEDTMMKEEYRRPRAPVSSRRHSASTPRDRGRLIVALDGRSWCIAEDHDVERQLQALAERLAEVLVAHVGAA